MTSNDSDCFVYITLPGQTEPVTAGKFVLTKNRQGISLGKFIYGKSYLARPDAVAFDPVELKLTDKTYETVALKGVFGALGKLQVGIQKYLRWAGSMIFNLSLKTTVSVLI